MKKTTTDFRLKGLSKPKSFTCYPMNNENIFWANSEMTHERFNALFDFCKHHWKEEKIAEIEHEGLYEDLTPINPMVINIRIK